MAINIFGQDTYREDEIQEALEQSMNLMTEVNWEGTEGWTLERIDLFAAITLRTYLSVNLDADQLVNPSFVEDYIHKTYFEKIT